jgi:hypothetical protein
VFSSAPDGAGGVTANGQTDLDPDPKPIHQQWMELGSSGGVLGAQEAPASVCPPGSWPHRAGTHARGIGLDV